ncbi:MAG: LD-carboxypeptidase [Puia sp.]|nr:LD-carboxypeptidase [Puia sp.]
MNRKHFLSSLLAAGSSLPSFGRVSALHGQPQRGDQKTEPGASAQIPPYLRNGDTIGITCPAGWITEAEIQPAIQQLERWGWAVRVGDTVGKKDFTFGGTDIERAADLQQMLDDPSLGAILCARGGYGAVRIVDRLDFSHFASQPKWIIGFSDITVLHAHLNRNLRIASVHSKMCNSFPDDWSRGEPDQITTLLSIRQLLAGERIDYAVTPDPNNRTGIAEGELIGGNLKTLETLAGTASDISTDRKILFVEDTGEYLYSIDRMFWNLERTGKLRGLKGLIVGGFKLKPDDAGEEFGRTLYDIVLERVRAYDYPVCFGFPVGHQKNNFALKCGALHKLQVSREGVVFEDLSLI